MKMMTKMMMTPWRKVRPGCREQTGCSHFPIMLLRITTPDNWSESKKCFDNWSESKKYFDNWSESKKYFMNRVAKIFQYFRTPDNWHRKRQLVRVAKILEKIFHDTRQSTPTNWVERIDKYFTIPTTDTDTRQLIRVAKVTRCSLMEVHR